MKRYFKKSAARFVPIMALLLVAMLYTVPVSAISVSGAKYMGSIAAGGSDTHVMTVGIGADEDPTDVLVEVAGFGQSMDKGYIALDPAHDLNPYSARTFITLDKTSVHIEPGTKQEVDATITLPGNVGAGGRYAIIYIHALPGKGKSFTTAVIVPVFITVANTTPTETGSITALDVGDVIVGQPVTIATSFKNTGDYHYYHTVNQVKVSDVKGNVIAQNSTPPSVYAIIPGNTVGFVVQPDISNMAIGTYSVESKVLLEDGRVLDTKTTTFDVKTNYVPPPVETSITLTPGSAGTLASSDGRYSVSFPQGSVVSDVVVTLKPYPHDRLNKAPAGATLGASSFEVAGLSGLLIKDATVRVVYSADDLAAAGRDALQLKLAYWDAGQGAWVILPTQVDAQNAALTANSNRMNIWTVMVSASAAGGAGTGLPQIPVLMGLSAVIIVIIVAAAVFAMRKRQRK